MQNANPPRRGHFLSGSTDFIQLLSILGRTDGAEVIRLARGTADSFSIFPVPLKDVAATLERLRTEQCNVWFEINPSAYSQQSGRSSAAHVTRLTALYADLDFKDAGLGDLNSCLEVVRALSSIIGYQPTAIVYTGGGIHPYWPLENAFITDENRADMQRRLKRWGALVKQTAKANGGDADSVYDLPRILRVPGTLNVKDAEHALETSVEFFLGTTPIDIPWVDEILDEWGITVDMVDEGEHVISPSEAWDWAESDCQFCDTAEMEIRTSQPVSRHHWALKYSAILHGMIRNGCVTESRFYELRKSFIDQFGRLIQTGNKRSAGPAEMNQILSFGMFKAQTWSPHKLTDELRGHIHYDAIEELVASPVTPPATNVTSIFTRQALPSDVTAAATNGNLALAINISSQKRLINAAFTDTGNAENLAQRLRGEFVHVPGIGWHQWDGSRYVPDNRGLVSEAAKDTFMTLMLNAQTDQQRKWAHNSLGKGRLNAAIELAKSIPYLVVEPLQLDAKPFELNTPNGIVDLATGLVREPDPAQDFHTKITRFAPERIPTPRFEAFLKFAIVDDARIAYVQRLFGVAAIGKVVAHVFPIFLGVGQNGKTTILDLMGGCLGAYASVMPNKFLIEKRGDTHPEEIAQLRGVRLAIVSEVPPGARFDEELVKRLTGETRLKARYMGENSFEFENTATLFGAMNHLPTVTVGGTGFWRRIRKIDFENQILLREQNLNLVQELLAEEGPGIMQWIIDGAVDFLKHGLRDPDKVIVSTREYQLEEDAMARFMEEMLVEAEGLETNRADVYETYRNWAFKQGAQPLPYIKFAREITQLKPMWNLRGKDVFTNMAYAQTSWQDLLEVDQ